MYRRSPLDEIRAELAAATAAKAAEVVVELRDELAREEARAAGTLVVYPADERLVSYWVRFTSGEDYQFWAEDAAHAIEQANDAEPRDTIDEVFLEDGLA